MIAVFIAAILGTTFSYLVLNIFQAVCLGVIVGILAYAFILSWQEKNTPKNRP
jgi:hypothetical protein